MPEQAEGAAYGSPEFPDSPVDLRPELVPGVQAGGVRTSEVQDQSPLSEDFKAGQLPKAAKAFAHINASGSFDPSRSKGVLASTYLDAGIGSFFCINLDPSVLPIHTLTATINGGGGEVDAQRANCLANGVAGNVSATTRDSGGFKIAKDFDLILN